MLWQRTARCGRRSIIGVKSRAARAAAKKKAFHIRLTTGINYNFIAVNDQLQYLDPDSLLLRILSAMKQ